MSERHVAASHFVLLFEYLVDLVGRAAAIAHPLLQLARAFYRQAVPA